MVGRGTGSGPDGRADVAAGRETMSPDRNDDGLKIGAGAIASFIGVGCLAVFMLQNRDETKINFLMIELTWPLWLVMLISAVLGALIWFGLGVMRRRSRRKARRS
jgi:uncharacterized integral membrane protein